MAANKFATMLHRKTNKLTLILVYAFLEWLLIFFLLLNSLFSYFIIKFADYFGLQKPCLWCSRLDHFFEPQNFQDSYRSLVCEAHAIEISKLGYCSNHRKLADSQDMCQDCSSSKNFVFFPWMNKLGVLQDFNGDKVTDNSVLISNCSCCGVSLDINSFSPDDFLIKPLWGDSDNTLKENLILEDEIDDEVNEQDHSDIKGSAFVCDPCGGKQGIDETREEKPEEKSSYLVSSFDCSEMVADESGKADIVMEKEQESVEKENRNSSCDEGVRVEARDVSSETQTQHLEFYIDQDACHLIPIEIERSKKISARIDKEEEKTCGEEDFILEFDKHVGTQYELVLETRSNFEEKVPLLPILECEDEEEDEEIIADLEARELNEIHKYSGMLADFEIEQECLGLPEEEMESHNHQESEGAVQMQMDEIEADISIGTEIQSQEFPPPTSNADIVSKKDEEQEVEFTTTEAEINSHLSFCSESNEIEEEKVPDTPTSEDNGNHLQKKFLLLERRESNTEESLDGSVTSDIEAGDGVLTVDKLKSALKAERKALNGLYAELEEERSASAVAANQTMAMINRLQEEKAAMQMEALQYQRMMEEQSEYDQEALELMNELMVKKEKERAELEKELEMYRKKVEEYEARDQKVLILKRRKESSTRSSATSSASFSNGEESDGLSVDLNQESKDENGFGSHQENTPVDAVVYLEDSLANFEEERLSILDQLKVLEEKLFTLGEGEDEDEEHLHLQNGNGNGNGYNEHFEVENGEYKEMNGRNNHYHMGAKAKRLLPLFDATEAAEGEEEMGNGHTVSEAEGEEVDSVMLLKSINKYEVDTKKLEIEEEVDHVYERLQALEADREFLKHCMTSLNKGDKGIQLLQQILQHLRDLRNVEARAKSVENGVA
ncbi:myosin-binding protein 2 [Euphorbia lathyris]|uniref:myosin-binding protein 2 n=1 Tax=Euphorbia lathyris TaxID=212925 RepID=UPI0033136467